MLEEIELWDKVYREAEKLERRSYRIRHGGLSRILEEDGKKKYVAFVNELGLD